MSPQRYNRTNFVTSSVAAKIIEAMTNARADGLQHYVTNKHEQRWLRVCIKPVEGCASGFTFEFLAGNGQDVGHLIMQALFVWQDSFVVAFGQLLSELYSVTAHPYELAKAAVLREQRQARADHLIGSLKDRGVTHSFRTPAGITVFGRFVRSWFGRKGFEVIADATGNAFMRPYKLDAEAFWYGTTQGALK